VIFDGLFEGHKPVKWRWKQTGMVKKRCNCFFEPPSTLRTQRKKKKRSKSHFFGCFFAVFAVKNEFNFAAAD